MRLAIAAAAGLCYWTSFQPSAWVRVHGLHAFGDLAYRGVGIFIPHLLLYSTLTAACCALAWLLLARAKALPPPGFAVSWRIVGWGVAGGVVSAAATLALLKLAHLGALHWIGFDGWSVAGNLFSNFFEEFIFRGFLLVALTSLVGFWPAAVVTSVAFGFEHTQYPLLLRCHIAVIGLFWSWIVRRARSLWAPYLAHMITDLIVDALFA